MLTTTATTASPLLTYQERDYWRLATFGCIFVVGMITNGCAIARLRKVKEKATPESLSQNIPTNIGTARDTLTLGGGTSGIVSDGLDVWVALRFSHD